MPTGCPEPVMAAITTEHFVLQTAASATISEAIGRSTLYLTTLSGGLVAVSISALDQTLLVPVLSLALLVVAGVGLQTTLVLVATGVRNRAGLNRIERIRAFYRGLDPRTAELFRDWDEPAGPGPGSRGLAQMSLPASRSVGWTTAAALIAVVNAVVTSTGLSLLLIATTGLHWLAAVLIGAVLAVGYLIGFFRWQDRRYRSASARESGSTP